MIKCRWCSANARSGAGPAVRPDWIRWHCNDCGAFGFLSNPTATQLSEVYTLAWQDPKHEGSFAAGSTDEKIARSLLKSIQFSPTGVKCLDYGGGGGGLARAITEMGCGNLTVFEPFGQNPMIPSVNWVNDINIISDESFDYIFMIEVLEHLLNPVEELVRLRKLLAPGGRLVITTPNARGWRARIHRFKWREAQNPTHINLFTQKSLLSCLMDAGFLNCSRISRPVNYRATGVSAILLAITQIIGIDGGLRFIATNSDCNR